MPSASAHCADCRRELGEPFEQVHTWLDALYKVLGPKHRSARHHPGGVEQVRKMWGDRAARAAEIHIMLRNLPFAIAVPGWLDRRS